MKRQPLIFTLIMLLLLPLQAQHPIEAQWIGAPWQGEASPEGEARVAPEFKKDVRLSKTVRTAKAYVTGLGFFEFYVNGMRVGDEVLTPNETSYGHRAGLDEHFISLNDSAWRDFRVFYLCHDISALLRKGDNRLGAIVGNGFYSPTNLRWLRPYGSPRFLCQIEIEYADGSRDTIRTGSDWEVRRTAIVENELYAGEIYDATLEGKDSWQAAVIRKSPDGRLMEQDGPADRVVRRLKPLTIKKVGENWEVDFGEYVTGWVSFHNFEARRGDTISVEFPIECAGNGAYRYIAAGGKVKDYAPRFCWWAFSKVVVKGWRGTLKPAQIEAEVVNSDVRQTGRFECSNPLINKINEIWVRTMLDNMHVGVVSDCPHREKGPYTGDGQVECLTAMHNLDMQGLYAKWIRDMADCQDTLTGYVPNGAPWHPGCGGGVPWGAAVCVMSWEHFHHYADTVTLRRNYPAMAQYVEYLAGWQKPNGTVLQQLPGNGKKTNYWMNLGEWCPPYNLVGENLVHTWYLWRCATYTAKAAAALGRTGDASHYRLLAKYVASSFVRAFYNPVAGSFESGSGSKSGEGYGTGTGGGMGDGSNIFGLSLAMQYPDLFPDTSCRRVVATIQKELDHNQGHLNTGTYGSSLFFDVLCDVGLGEAAYTAFTKEDFPSFGNWIRQGAQTTWEQWNGEDSHNHPAFGGALSWLYRRVCGLQATTAGYRTFEVRPMPVGDLQWASYTTESPMGTISVRWQREGEDFTLMVQVPEGASASVVLPDGSPVREVGTGAWEYKCRLEMK